MPYLLLILLLFVPNSAFAEFDGEAYLEGINQEYIGINWRAYNRSSWPYDPDPVSAGQRYCQARGYALDDVSAPWSTSSTTLRANVSCTDYGGWNSYVSGRIDQPYDYPALTTDEQCLALNDDYGDDMTMILDFDPGEMEWEGTGTGAGCMFATDPGVAVEVGGKWHVPFHATGATEETSGSTDPIEATGPEAPEGGELASSDDYTPTSDPETDCQYSNVTLGGETYCYTGEYAPQDASYPDGSVRVDNPDGSYDIVEPDGTTTEYNADGGIKSPSSAPGTADGESYGEDTDGIIGAISGLKKAVNDGFNGLVDTFTGKADEMLDDLTEDAPDADGMIADSNLDEVSDQVDQAATDHTDDVLEKLDEIGDDDSSPIADQVTSHLPSLPGSSCSPLTFGTEPFAFTISCEIFTKFRNWFGWLLYFWTAVSIIDIFFAPTTRRA